MLLKSTLRVTQASLIFAGSLKAFLKPSLVASHDTVSLTLAA